MLRQIAEQHDATPRQVALRFLVSRRSVFTIPKSSSPEHVIEKAGAGDLELTEADIARIDKAFPVGPPPRELPTFVGRVTLRLGLGTSRFSVAPFDV